jgi:hypothetical protein
MELMIQSGLEFVRANASFTAGGQTFPAGSYVIPPQAYRPYVVDLMEPKVFPDRRQFPGGPPIPPYDMTGYELRYQMGLEAVNVEEPFEMPPGEWGSISRAVGVVRGSEGTGYLVDGSSNWLYRALGPYLNGGGTAFRVTTVPSGDGAEVGAYWLPDLTASDARAMADQHGLSFTRPAVAPTSGLAPVRMPRVALYRSWRAAMPEGWTRWVLDQYGIPWENVWDEDVRGGALSDYDVLILPSQDEAGIRDGHAPGSMPEQYVGGLGPSGTAAVRTFVEGGGRLVAIDEAVDYAISTFALPFRNTVRGVSTQDFFLPGSIIRLSVDPGHPLAYGVADDAVTLFARSQVLERTDGGRRTGVSTPVCYADTDYLISGWTLGGDRYLAGRTAAAEVDVGSGDVVLFAFEPHFRGQPRNTFKLLFNALMGASTEGLPSGRGLDCR